MKTAKKTTKSITVPAIQVKQGKSTIYTFAVDGKVVRSFATISRLKRDAESKVLGGYQRPEVLSHIAEIRQYVESDKAMIPNAVVIAFNDRVKFKADPARPDEPPYLRRGVLVIPADSETPDEEKAGFVVDGQQRLAAIRDADVTAFPIAVSAFITNDVSVQTEQFILVNSTKPLHKGLIYELLPTTKATLPSALQRRRFPATLLERLNLEDGSPLKGMIQTQTNPYGTIKDNSILKMLENSMNEGALYRMRGHSADGDNCDTDGMFELLCAFWGAVSRVFPEAWSLPPKKSRLVHGAGIVGLGFVMDAICDSLDGRVPATEEIEEQLALLAPACCWTEGEWDFGPKLQRKWNELQNVSNDIAILSNYLLVKHKELVRDKSGRREKVGAR